MVNEINLGLAAINPAIAPRAIVAVVHVLPPNLFPQTGGAVIESLNLLGEGVGHGAAVVLGNERG
jgi:hypothetical protein